MPGKGSQRSERYYGYNACIAIWQHRPIDILRAYIQETRVKSLSPFLKWMADQKKPYEVVGPAKMQELTDSVHHQGVCIVAREQARNIVDDTKKWEFLRNDKADCVFLDQVENPHNLGGIIRTATWFGVDCLLGDLKMPRLSPSTCRVAEGGAETLTVQVSRDPKTFLTDIKASGFKIIGTDHKRGSSLFKYEFPAKAVIVFGNEVSGISDDITSTVDQWVKIPGTEKIESLNVSVATGIVLAELYRQRNR